MRYVSTRGQAPVLGFEDTMLAGLARDGGLYVPETVPTLSPDEIAGLAGKPYEEVAVRVMAPFVAEAFDEATLGDLVRDAYAGFGHAARAPLVQLGPNHHLLELFHGPTLAFKDFAMQLIGRMFQHVLARRGDAVTIVGATSGDTGSAAIEAFAGLDGVDVFILYPHGRVSDVQRRQMTTPEAANVHALALTGHFDDCQARVKDMFNDFGFRDRVGLAGVNSINFARVLAQVVYYFTAATALGAPHRPVSFCVPTGNFGDIFAGHIAKRMGLPIERLVVATNENDILARCLDGIGDYRKHGVIPTTSPSMDIEVSSNFERALFWAYGNDGDAVTRLMRQLDEEEGFRVAPEALQELERHYDAMSVDEPKVSAAITEAQFELGELICPHTAIGYHVGKRYARRNSNVPMVTLATAHPAKFPDAVEAATGIRPDLPARMSDLFDRPERITRVENDLGRIEALIDERRVA
ncbi:MAG: threonine synthase [Pseudomonadota bacterium]